MSLIDKLRNNSTIKEASILSKSKVFKNTEFVSADIPALNIAFSGDLDGGFSSGLTQWAGPSKHFKTAFCLLMAKAYLDKYPDAVLLLYDSEFGSPDAYFKNFDIDKKRVFHTPIVDVESLRSDIMNQLANLERGDKVFILVDSLGMLASRKETEDAVDQKSVADMTRARAIKSLFRMVTVRLKLKDIPMVVVNHTYKTMEMYAKDIVGGGTGSYLAADNIYILGRQQDKSDDNKLVGHSFIINVEKSRFVREKSKIPIEVSYEKGINKYSGLLEIAQETGHVVKPSKGWYSRVNIATGEIESEKFRESQTNTAEFWNPILSNNSFKEAVRQKFQLVKSDDVTTTEEDDEDEE